MKKKKMYITEQWEYVSDSEHKQHKVSMLEKGYIDSGMVSEFEPNEYGQYIRIPMGKYLKYIDIKNKTKNISRLKLKNKQHFRKQPK